MGIYYWIQAIVAALVIFDMYRRPEADWVSADKQRGFWSTFVGITGLLGLSPLAIIMYGLMVYPHLDQRRDPFPVSQAFRRE